MATVLPITTVFAQNNSQYTAAVIGTWKPEKEGLTARFNADGTFTMSEEGENAEAMAPSVSGTYTVTDTVINMSITVDGKHYSLKKSYRKINDDTLQVDRQNYRRVVQ
jgi:hypothetical protein